MNSITNKSFKAFSNNMKQKYPDFFTSNKIIGDKNSTAKSADVLFMLEDYKKIFNLILKEEGAHRTQKLIEKNILGAYHINSVFNIFINLPQYALIAENLSNNDEANKCKIFLSIISDMQDHAATINNILKEDDGIINFCMLDKSLEILNLDISMESKICDIVYKNFKKHKEMYGYFYECRYSSLENYFIEDLFSIKNKAFGNILSSGFYKL